MTIAFVGLGAMGRRMAGHLLDAGHDLVVHNRTPEHTAALLDRGARWAPSPSAATRQADVVFTMLTDERAAAAVWLGEHGILSGLRPGSHAVECSTVRPAWIRRIASEVHTRGAHFVEAPVLGSTPQAEARQLVVLAGGEAIDIATLRPLFDGFAKATLHLGPHGTASAMKLAANTLFASQVAVLGELLEMLAQEGIEGHQAMAQLAKLPVTAAATAAVGEQMIAKQFTAGFPVRLVAKDLAYCSSLTHGSAIAGALDRYRALAEAGYGNEHLSAAVRRIPG